ncbi:futalosine hydrolase [Geoalkalibacter halelectricus]|uniref:Futalosine hydrolase n=1 Tax=Geoalkalibacter halelectricus TaxID=2847045 RepID=A0ABY5ZJ46_9BACT|nr:futalosine hydrolase [Geoalkalibacter halelectricus]MDO3378254.1 futalosine hydrolase [Geoalkalibacter halelectricus]UWZ79155.1 futalosine hydrolase [Geoalkalibacter halelectricus]
MIALIAATPQECPELRAALRPAALPGGYGLFRGRLAGQAVELAVCGLGKANAAAATALLLAQARPRLVISFGCGGAFPGTGLKPGDLALATAERYGDEGVETPEGFLDLRALGFALVRTGARDIFDTLPVDPSWLSQARAAVAATAARRGRAWREGVFTTVSTCSGSDRHSARIQARTGALCETMEGAAVAQVCAAFDLPFLNIRGISNPTGDRDRAAWDLPGACAAAEEAVSALLAGLPAEDSSP